MADDAGRTRVGMTPLLRRSIIGVGGALGLVALLFGILLAPVTMGSASGQSSSDLVAHDGTGSYSNPPCTATYENGVCISGISVDFGASTVTLTTTVGLATDPSTPEWDSSDAASFVEWHIATNGATYTGDGANNFQAIDGDSTQGGGFIGEITTYQSGPVCTSGNGVSGTYDLAADSYSISFPVSCIGAPTSLSVVGIYQYGYQGGNFTYDEETCCTVDFTSTLPTTTTTTATTSPPNTTTTSSTTTTTTSLPTTTTTSPPVTTTTTGSSSLPVTAHGYWLVGSDGGIFSFGAAQFQGSEGGTKLQRPVVGITPTADRGGYWLVASDGGIFSFGDTSFYGSIPGIGLGPAGSSAPKKLNAPIVGMVPTSDGRGYFMVASDGGIFGFGDANFEGSCPSIGGCSGAAVAVIPDASGNGYWLFTATGHVYAFGNAVDYGQPGPQFVPVTAAARTADGGGYWILFSNGVVVPYGDAAAYGGPAGLVGGSNPATSIFATSDGEGYWVATGNGSVYNYGDAPYDGSEAGTHLNGSIVAASGS
jgi:hypothetical protein